MAKKPVKKVSKKGKTVKERVAALLASGREILKRYGWITGEEGDCSTGFCAIGALQYAALGAKRYPQRDRFKGKSKVYNKALEAVKDVLPGENHSDDPEEAVYEYNDGPANSRKKILNIFRKAEKRILSKAKKAKKA